MIKRDQLINFLDTYFGQELMDKAKTKDPDMANGIQLKGKAEVNKIVLGVSIDEKFLQEAINASADFIIVHHGLCFSDLVFINKSWKKRLKILLDNDLSLAGYHFILDSHKKIGNNATIIKELGGQIKERFFDDWGWIGEFDQPQSIEKVSKDCSKLFNHDVFAVMAGPTKVTHFGVVSGGGVPRTKQTREIIEKNLELYITGEIRESRPAEFEELGINYFSAGHYATEVFGVQELGKVIKDHFKDKLEVEFIEIANPL
jgi:dinuclear metal center YbgI/SA1388 family protein